MVAMLLLHTDASGGCADNFPAFCCLANMADRSPLLGLYALKPAELALLAAFFEELLTAVDPELAAHLGAAGLGLLEDCNLFLLDWALTLWCKPGSVALSLWTTFRRLHNRFTNINYSVPLCLKRRCDRALGASRSRRCSRAGSGTTCLPAASATCPTRGSGSD